MGNFTSFPIPTITTTNYGLPLSVKDPLFGAKGDGVTDDTAAVQAALNYAASNSIGFVYLPTGTYIVSSQIVIPAQVYLLGDGKRVSGLLASGS